MNRYLDAIGVPFAMRVSRRRDRPETSGLLNVIEDDCAQRENCMWLNGNTEEHVLGVNIHSFDSSSQIGLPIISSLLLSSLIVP